MIDNWDEGYGVGFAVGVFLTLIVVIVWKSVFG